MKILRSGLKGSLSLLLLYATVIAGVAGLTGCPDKGKVRTAVEASYRLPGATNDIIRNIADARDRGIISVESARKFGDVLNKMAKAEVTYVEMVRGLEGVLRVKGKVDAGDLKRARDFFDASIIGPFLDVLEFASVLSGEQVKLILVAITAARILITTIGGGLGSKALGTMSKFITSGTMPGELQGSYA